MPANVSTKEFKLENKSCFKTMCGTLNKEKPNVIYVKGRAKIRPNVDCKNYAPYVKKAKEDVQKFVSETFKSHGIFNDKFIFSCDISECSLSTKKISNIKYELYIKPYEIKPVRQYSDELIEVSDSIEEILLKMTDDGLFTIN